MGEFMTELVLNKKTVFFMVLFWLSVFGTIAQANGQSDNAPPWINDVPPENEYWGIGTAKLVNSKNSMNLAELRARCSIAGDIYARVFQRAGDDEFNNLYLFFMEYAQIEASFEIINDTRVLRTWEAPDGTSWCLIAMHKADAKKYTSICENIYQKYYNEVFRK
jgi:hypothetical protein